MIGTLNFENGFWKSTNKSGYLSFIFTLDVTVLILGFLSRPSLSNLGISTLPLSRC